MDDTSTPSDRFAEALWELLKPKLDAYLTEKGFDLGQQEQDQEKPKPVPRPRKSVPDLQDMIDMGVVQVGQYIYHKDGHPAMVVEAKGNRVNFGGELMTLSEAATKIDFPGGVSPGQSGRTGYNYWGMNVNGNWMSFRKYRKTEAIQTLWQEFQSQR